MSGEIPWKIERYGHEMIVSDANDELVAIVEGDEHRAHLIAAAPTMYEAVKNAPDVPVGMLADDEKFRERVMAWFVVYQGWQFGIQTDALAKASGKEPVEG
jgi:hypothetical protein